MKKGRHEGWFKTLVEISPPRTTPYYGSIRSTTCRTLGVTTADTEVLPLGKDGGTAVKKEMEDIGFRDVKVSKVNIPLFAPSGTGYHELFDFVAKGNPIEVRRARANQA